MKGAWRIRELLTTGLPWRNYMANLHRLGTRMLFLWCSWIWMRQRFLIWKVGSFLFTAQLFLLCLKRRKEYWTLYFRSTSFYSNPYTYANIPRMNEWVPFLFQQCNDGYWRMGSVFRRKSNTVVQFASVIYLPRSTVLRWIWWWLWLVFFAGQWMTVSSTRIVIFFIYVYSMVWALFPLFGWGGYGKEWIVHS